MLLLNRKAYTLSQFILLWILGILFVILVCLNVLRYRATAQARAAEAFMQEVRMEQEDRCAVGRKYAVYSNHLKTFYKRTNTSKSIRYDLSSGSGISAHHKLLDFRLQMPSYADGRICCDNCEKLNRYYMHCDTLQKSKDFVPAEPECAFYTTKKNGKTTASKEGASAANSEEVLREPVEKLMAPAADQPSASAQDSAEVPAPQGPTVDAVERAAAQPQPASADASPVSAVEETPLSAPEGQEETQPSAEQPVKECKVPSQGDFFIDECAVYQAGTQGSVVHTWNGERCAYDITQSCLIPAQWKAVNNTKEEKGLYPSDVEDYCSQLLKSAPCPKTAAAGQQCGAVNTVCYKDCQITDQTEVRESALVVFYDVQVKIKQLRCMPGKEVTVSVP